LLSVAPCNGCTTRFYNPFGNTSNLKNLANHGIGPSTYNLFNMLHTTCISLWFFFGYVPMEKEEKNIGVHELK
jgi:hypothetical protein